MSGRPVFPRKRLGQHFLVDENILGVIGRLAALHAGDVVLEVGPGLGILTAYLADRVALVHAVEVDSALEPHLRARLGERRNVELVFADALALEVGALDPPPTKLVANLPYNVATPLVMETVERMPTLEHWCVMVQREVADRFIAAPGSKDYGSVSVLLGLTTERVGFHAVSPTVFRPPPRVASALVAFRRHGPLPHDYARVKRLVEAAFSHRRKTLANAVELAGVAARAETAAALADIGRPADARAEQLAAEEFPRLARLLA